MVPLLLLALLPLQGVCWGARQSLLGTATNVYLGSSVALSGDRLLVSSERSGGGSLVYLRGASGWELEGELTGSTGSGPADQQRVALDGDLALVGDRTHDAGQTNVGHVLVYRRDPGGWAFEAELLAQTPQKYAELGTDVATSMGRVVAGAPGSRSVHVFERDASGWSETHVVRAPAPGAFGEQVALEGDLLAVGGGQRDLILANEAVHLFRWDGVDWTLEATLPTPGDVIFPGSLALSQGRLAVGAPTTVYGDPDGDRVLVYERLAGTWTETADLRPAPASGRFVAFGRGLALEGARLAVGCPATQQSPDRARVVLFDDSSGAWTELATLTPDEGRIATPGDSFGRDVALRGETVVAADSLRDQRRGEAWIFENDPLWAPAVGYRGAPGNPVSYAASEPRVGEALRLTVAPALSGHTQALVFGFDAPGSLVLGGGQTLLCLDAGGNGELLNTGFAAGPIATFVLAVPLRSELVGATLSTQALHAFGAPGFALSNAQDLRIGAPSAACP